MSRKLHQAHRDFQCLWVATTGSAGVAFLTRQCVGKSECHGLAQRLEERASWDRYPNSRASTPTCAQSAHHRLDLRFLCRDRPARAQARDDAPDPARCQRVRYRCLRGPCWPTLPRPTGWRTASSTLSKSPTRTRSGQSRTGQDRTGQDRTGRSRWPRP